MLRRFSRSFMTLAVSLAALYGVEPAMAHHLVDTLVGPFRQALDLVTRAH